MTPYLLVALGGAAGSVVRFAVASAIDAHLSTFPYGTLAINISGSCAIGLLATLLPRHPGLQQLLMVGVLGGYTTFSSFSLQTVRLLQDGRWSAGGMYMAASVILCVLGAALGLWLGQLATRGP